MTSLEKKQLAMRLRMERLKKPVVSELKRLERVNLLHQMRPVKRAETLRRIRALLDVRPHFV